MSWVTDDHAPTYVLGNSPMTTPPPMSWVTDDHAPAYVLKHNSEGGVVLACRGLLKTFDFWAEMPIFDTSCFLIRFQIQKQQKPQQKMRNRPNVRF